MARRQYPLHRFVDLRLLVWLVAGLLVAAASSATTAPSARAQSPDPTTPTTPTNPTPPQPTTGAATPTGTSTATVTGSLTTGGADTTYRFDYGTSTSYGLTTATAAVPAAPSPASATANLSGLTPSTTYHYRLVATNAAGTVVGADRTVTTAAAPRRPAVATRSATDLAATTATIVGRVNPYGQPTTYRFEWGTSTAYGAATASASVAVGPTATVTAPLSGLQPNTRYVFRVVATNAAGTARSTSRSFTTGRGLTGVSLTATRRTISWEGSTIISGVVRGAAPGGTKVRLLRQDHPFSAPYREVGTQTSNAAGGYAFTLNRIYGAARLRVVAESTPSVESTTLGLRSRVLARLGTGSRRAASVVVRGRIYPASAGTRVSLQRRTTTGRWITVARPRLSRSASGRASFSRRLSRSRSHSWRYRLVVTPNDDGAHVTTTSASVLVPRRR